MTSRPTLRLRVGDIVSIDDKAIGVIRYIGWVKDLSNAKNDDFVGVEMKYKYDNTVIGIETDGKWNNYTYFNTSHDNKGRFVKPHNITKQFTSEQLFDCIPNKASLLPPSKQMHPNISPTPPKSAPGPKPTKKTEAKSIQIAQDSAAGVIASRLTTFCTSQEVQYLVSFCNEERFTELDDIKDDLDVFEDSLILDAMKSKFEWNQSKIQQFAALALNASPEHNKKLAQTHIEQKSSTSNNKENHDKYVQITTHWKLPSIAEFIVPPKVMEQRNPRCINDILTCFKMNHISQEALSKLKKFCTSQHYTFADIQNKMTSIRQKLKSDTQYNDLFVFMDFIDKCIYELAPPMFQPMQFTKQDEKDKYNYFEKQCKGVIKHDRDLLQYFCITEHTEKKLSSELIDIADRFAVAKKEELNIKRFGNKYFFKDCDKKHINIITSGLRKYHNRFLPVFPMKPLRLIADTMNGYQHYCILLSHVVSAINKQISLMKRDTHTLMPYMIDMLIIPPGCFTKIADPNSKTYDASGPMKIGDIKKRLEAFQIPVHEMRSYTDKKVDEAITRRIVKQIVQIIKNMTSGFSKQYQRICIVVDRRWRIRCKHFDAFNKLRKGASDNASDGEGKSSKGWNLFSTASGGKDANDSNDIKKHDFYNKTHDTIYVYQPQLQKTNTSYHEFKADYCHETLIYLTKQCIIPRKDHYMHIGGDAQEGWLFNISAHIQMPSNELWYKYNQKWYVFFQSAALRFFPEDMFHLWPRYFVDSDEDTNKLTLRQINTLFAINLNESDSSYKRWYYAIKRSD